jgi:hypothetical protein
MQTLTKDELVQLVKAVFPKLPQDKKLAIFVDVPNKPDDDKPKWHTRRQLAYEWAQELKSGLNDLELEEVALIAYASVDSNNADLPEYGFQISEPVPDLSSELSGGKIAFADVFAQYQLFLAPTQYSTTAPMKVNARTFGFRAATMPGFAPSMIPALRIDYGLVNERCQLMKQKLDPAIGADITFLVDDTQEYNIYFDLRHRPGHASGGRFPNSGTAGNLPSGETYIVPYEGEMEEPSETYGALPVQFDDEIVLFKIEANTATGVLTDGEKSRERAEYLKNEPAYGNMAELGFGILGDFGLQPTKEILLDEKLAFHIAFGRSDHFGGMTGPHKFSSPQAVVHIDYIYSPKMQPRIQIKSLDLVDEKNKRERIIENDQYLIF